MVKNSLRMKVLDSPKGLDGVVGRIKGRMNSTLQEEYSLDVVLARQMELLAGL